MKFIIDGKPVAKQRPRFSRTGVFDLQKKEKNDIQIQILSQLADRRPFKAIEGAIKVEMRFYTPIPNSWSQKRKKAVFGKPDTRRPDIDNYAKLYADAMNGLIYKDDALITELWCEKRFCDTPRVEIIITQREAT